MEVMDLPQRAVLWPATGASDAYGQTLVDFPVEISVRWLSERKPVLSAEGRTVTLDSGAIVDRRIPADSWMWLGTLEQWYSGQGAYSVYGSGTAPGAPVHGTGSAAFDPQIMEVMQYVESPDIKGRAAYREVHLIRLPAAHAAQQPGIPGGGGLTGTFNAGVHP